MAKYTKEQIRDYVQSQNIGNDPQAMYKAAKQYGITGSQMDEAMGWAGGSTDQWTKQQGLANLSAADAKAQKTQVAGGLMSAPASSPTPFGQSTIGSYQDRLAAQNQGQYGGSTQQQALRQEFINGNGGTSQQPAQGGAPMPTGGSLIDPREANGGLGGGGRGNVPSGYVNHQGQGGYPPGYNASNAPMYGAGQGGNQQGPAPYGYGNRPNQGGGYYEQQTPAGSFAAANQQNARAFGANAYNTQNPYIGQQSQGIQGAPGVMQYAQGAQYNNPYLGQQSERSQNAGQNAYAGPNQYLEGAIGRAAGDMQRSFKQTVVPELDRMAQQSGSFGNSGVQQVQNEAYRDLGENIGNVSNQMRMQDYTTQQGLAESSLNRGQANNQFNAGMSANDLSRNLAGGFQGNAQNNNYLMQGAMFDSGNALNTQQFNSSLGNNDLTRNSNLAQAQGQFNTGALNTNSMFNAGNMNTNSMFNAGQGNNMNQFNASAGNNMLENYRNRQQNQGQFDANLGNNRYQFDQSLGSQNRQFDATLGQNAYQFDQNLDRGIYNDNMGWANTGFNNTMNLMNNAYNWSGGGVNATTAQQNAPMNYWQQFANAGNQAGGQGGTATNSQNMQGNPYLGAWGGWNMFAPRNP